MKVTFIYHWTYFAFQADLKFSMMLNNGHNNIYLIINKEIMKCFQCHQLLLLWPYHSGHTDNQDTHISTISTTLLSSSQSIKVSTHHRSFLYGKVWQNTEKASEDSTFVLRLQRCVYLFHSFRYITWITIHLLALCGLVPWPHAHHLAALQDNLVYWFV